LARGLGVHVENFAECESREEEQPGDGARAGKQSSHKSPPVSAKKSRARPLKKK
jgi:hypothetical protein